MRFPKPHPFVSVFPLNEFVQEGEFYAHSAAFGITSLIPKTFLNQSFEAEEAAKELTIQAAKKIKAEEKAKKSVAVKQASSKQKIKKQAATDKKEVAQKAAGHAAPAKEDTPVKRCTVSFPSARAVLVSAVFFFAATMALWSNSSMSTGAAEVVTTKSVTSWSDVPNGQQCKMHDDNGVRNDFTAVQEAFETSCPAEAAEGFYLSTQPSAFTVTTGPRQRVAPWARFALL